MREFFVTGRMLRAINCTTLTILPKVPNPSTIKDYRPIVCCTVLCKLISKVLASRIQKVIASVISDTQSGFIPGRKIVDNVIVAHELVQAYNRKNISPRCMIKVDIQKAYDTVDWYYLEQMLRYLGFPNRFIRWVMECITTVNYSVLINGKLTKAFAAARGLGQGDPMSLFLFAIVMEYLSRSLSELKENKLLRYHPKCRKLNIIHLSFADDLLMFARGDPTSITLLYKKFQVFTSASGLQANLTKSFLYCGGINDQEKQQLQLILRYNLGELPLKYFGISLDTKNLNNLQWQPLVDKIVARISSWTAKKLSYASRVQLVQTVIFGVQAY